jgi:hypothetical protein
MSRKESTMAVNTRTSLMVAFPTVLRALISGLTQAADAHTRRARRIDPTGNLERACNFDPYGAFFGGRSLPCLTSTRNSR